MNPIYPMVKEIQEVSDSKKAALMLQSGIWVTISAVFHGDEVVWIMGRVEDLLEVSINHREFTRLVRQAGLTTTDDNGEA